MAIQLPNPGLGDGQTGDNEFVMWTKVKDNFNNQTHAASRLVGTNTGNLMEAGAFGLGAGNIVGQQALTTSPDVSGIYKYDGDTAALMVNWNTGNYSYGITFGYGTASLVLWHKSNGDKVRYGFYHQGNTTKDSNGFLKGKSPVTRLFSDRLEHQGNDKELKQIELEKLGVGDYLLKNTTGLANEGWYIETPKDANGNVLVAVVYEQLENNDISVKTYDYILNKKGRIVPDVDTPLDIPETRWIDLRFNEIEKDEVANEPIE